VEYACGVQFEGLDRQRFGQNQALGLDHLKDLIHRHVVQFLHNPRRPFDPERVDGSGIAEAEVGCQRASPA
jgi:hypothetical protein